jgi:hypothetical protein
VDAAAVERLLAKLRRFAAEELDAEERVVLASLLAPAVSMAYDETDVTGFGTTAPGRLPVVLTEALRRSGVRVVGLGDGP